MRLVVFFLLIFILKPFLNSQIGVGDQDGITAESLYITDDLIFSKKKESIDPRLEIVLTELKEKNLDFIILEGQPQKVLLKFENNYLFWLLIANKQDYFLLCAAQTLNNPCRCLDRFYLYIPDKNLLQKIKPWYAWPSLAKKNLVKTLNSYSLETLKADDFESYCELITYLRK